jgi:hypothetical protein
MLLVPLAGGSHGEDIWAGKWLTSTGTLRLSVPSALQVDALKTDSDRGLLWDKLTCKKGPQFYMGTYGTKQGDSGRVVACGTKNRLFARFLSTGRFRGAAGSFSITIASTKPLRFTGTYREDSGGSGPYTGQWELHFRGDSEHATPSGPHVYKGPFEVRAHFHAQNLLTQPPSDGGQCPAGAKPAIVTGQIIGRRTDQGEIQGGGNVAAAPHLARCRVPAIQVRVDDVELRVIIPGKRLRVELDVRISAGLSQGVHQPGNCRVNTRGRIVAIYDDTLTAANGLRDHRLTIGPWASPCNAHNHVITNSITSIPANASSSTWVRVNVLCPGQGTGLGPKNCV